MNSRQKRTLIWCLVFSTTILVIFYNAPPSSLTSPVGTSLRMNIVSPSEMKDRPPSCKPQTHIMFLKTHKCASSTVQNILLRYGYRHNLTFAFPKYGNYLGNPQIFRVSMLPKALHPSDRKVDIFAMHTRLNVEEHTKILHKDTLWMTVVRNPSDLYESLFNFFHLEMVFGITLPHYVDYSLEKLSRMPRAFGKFGRNQMLFDFGYPDNLSVAELRAALDQLDYLFDVVMVSEFMDESLILLSHRLCWSLNDVIYFSKNARRKEVKPPINTQVLQVLRELNSADVIIYEHFLEKHNSAILKFGPQRMAKEVAALRHLRDEYYEDCGMREVSGQDPDLMFKEYSDQVSAYVTKNNSNLNCMLLSLPELSLVEAARFHQSAMLNSSSKRS